MGRVADAVAWTQSWFKRDNPKYSTPSAPPADGLLRQTNSDDSITFMRRYVAEGSPARTKPPSATDSQPSKPNALDAAFQKMVDRRSPQTTQYPRYDNTTTNYSGDAPDRGRDLRYGLQPDSVGTTPDRPGSTFGLQPADPAGNAKPDVDK
jgi:hypothetical protein